MGERKVCKKKTTTILSVCVCASLVVSGICVVSSCTINKHMDTQAQNSIACVCVCVLRLLLWCRFLYAAIVSAFRCFTCLNAAAAKAIILAWKFANSHIQSFHYGDSTDGDDDGYAMLVLMCLYVFVVCCCCLWFFPTWFLNKFSLLCQSSTQALKINTDMCVPAPVRS